MKKQLTLSIVLVILAAALITLQYTLSVDVRYDQQTEEDLQTIETAISGYARIEDKLPEQLADLSLDKDVVERASERNYEYIKGAKSGSSPVKALESDSPFKPGIAEDTQDYKLCAVFKKQAGTKSQAIDYYGYYDHPAGRACFSRTAYF